MSNLAEFAGIDLSTTTIILSLRVLKIGRQGQANVL